MAMRMNSAHCVFQTVVNVILNKRFFGLLDCLFHSMHLLCGIETRATFF